jgi:hypothetical protein
MAFILDDGVGADNGRPTAHSHQLSMR